MSSLLPNVRYLPRRFSSTGIPNTAICLSARSAMPGTEIARQEYHTSLLRHATSLGREQWVGLVLSYATAMRCAVVR
eukprot:1943394-Rhodomonas_salina.1